MNFSNIILAVVIVGVVGLVFGLILAFASVVFAVETDEREEKILSELPGANCGGCGFAGCSAYAAAVVKGEAPVNGCPVGKDAVASKIAQIMGVTAESVEKKIARVKCNGSCDKATDKYEYRGIEDCAAAAKLGGGAKACPSGCLGLGSCVKVCPYGAISVIDGVAVVDEDKCQACGLCVSKCPKSLIELISADKKYYVSCSNTEKGAVANKYCTVACIGCKLCEKNCSVGAIKVDNNLAKIDYTICINCGVCAEKCPKGAIVGGSK